MIKPFTTDGCSGGLSWLWRKITGKPTPWEDLCEEHDLAYWAGGTEQQRHIADLRLCRAVHARGNNVIAALMLFSIGVFGHPLMPLPWRWGFAKSWPRHYSGSKFNRARCWLRGWHCEDFDEISKFRYDVSGICRDCGKVGSGERVKGE